MSCNVEMLEKSMAKLTIEVSAEDFEKALERAYQKQKSKIALPGFRKGKAPRALVEKMYGAEVFYEDAANDLIPDAYADATKDLDLEIVSRPEIDATQLEKGKSFIFTATVALKPEVKLGKYKGLKVEKEDTTVTDEEIDAEIKKQAEMNATEATVEGRPVQDGDIAVIDYAGFDGDVQFDGGTATDHPLTIGSHSFIDNFEEQIIGMNIGDTKDINVTFPAEYHAEELAGKPVKFTVTVKSIKEKQIPAIDDELASEVSDFDTLAEYKEDVKKNLTERKEKAAKSKLEDAAIDMIIEASEMEVQDSFVDTQVQQMAQETAQRMQAQGIPLDMYLKYTGMTTQGFLDTLRPQALKRIQVRLVLEEIVKAEKIEVSDDEYNDEVQKMADAYGMKVEDLTKEISDKEVKQIKMDIAVGKAIDVIVNSVK